MGDLRAQDSLFPGLDKQGSADLLKFLEEGGDLDGFLNIDGNLDAGLLGEAINNGQLGKLLSMKSFDVKQLENDMPGLTRDVSMFINKLQRGDSAAAELADVPTLIAGRSTFNALGRAVDEDENPGLPYAEDYRPSKSKSPNQAALERKSLLKPITVTTALIEEEAARLRSGSSGGGTGSSGGRGRGRRGQVTFAPGAGGTPGPSGNGTDGGAAPAGRGARKGAGRGKPATNAAAAEAQAHALAHAHHEAMGEEGSPSDDLDDTGGEGEGLTADEGGAGAGPKAGAKKPAGRRGGRSRKRKEPMSADDRAMKKLMRMEKNRESAARSRQKKQEQLETLERQVEELQRQNQELAEKVEEKLQPRPEKPAEKIITRGLRKTQTLPSDFKL